MKPWIGGRGLALLAFALIALLVFGGLGWVTGAALRLEKDQITARFEGDIRRALWRLDSKAFTTLAAEANRPLRDYALSWYAPQPGKDSRPLVQVCKLTPNIPEAPNWIREHYVVFRAKEWRSALTSLSQALERIPGANREEFLPPEVSLPAATEAMLTTLAFSPIDKGLETSSEQIAGNENVQAEIGGADAASKIDRDTQSRLQQAAANRSQQMRIPQQVEPASLVDFVSFGVPTPKWHNEGAEPRLVVCRDIRIGQRSARQVTVIDWPGLQAVLRDEVRDLLPATQFLPARESGGDSFERTMTALPVEISPGPVPWHVQGIWSPLKIGLVLSWAAAVVALTAVGLGGGALWNLSERRIGFVSAVTHELRTPLTTLRLYLDMLASGLVRDEKQKDEYIQTLNVEADRLNRLVGNVLDFSRLENHRPRLEMCTVAIADLLEQVQSTWLGRCEHSGKELVVENEVGEVKILTDVSLVSQILGNLIDNACKYSHGAEDPRIWLRARRAADRSLCLEVEDRGAGVAKNETRSIFRAFRRGRSDNVSVGGVGLGLALAQKWARLLGGNISVTVGQSKPGACFRVELPARTLTA
jgi:signal transduction histidine kinase